MEITMAKTSPIGITPERQDYSCLLARDQHKQESEGPARAGDRREGVGVEMTHPQRSQVTPPPPCASSLILELTQGVGEPARYLVEQRGT